MINGTRQRPVELPEGISESGGILFYVKEGYYEKFRILKSIKEINNNHRKLFIEQVEKD